MQPSQQTKQANRGKIVSSILAHNPFRSARMMDPSTAMYTNLARQGIGGTAGYMASEPMGNMIEEYGLPKGEKLNPVAKMSERAINTVLGAFLAGRGNIASNPKLLTALSTKSVLLGAPIGIHHGMQFLENASRTSGNMADASKNLNAVATDGANKGKPALQVMMESLGGTAEKIENLTGSAPQIFDRLEQAPVNSAQAVMNRFGAGIAPVAGGLTGAFVGNLLGDASADRARTPEDIRKNDRRRALMTLVGGGLGVGAGWAGANPDQVSAVASSAGQGIKNILGLAQNQFAKS